MNLTTQSTPAKKLFFVITLLFSSSLIFAQSEVQPLSQNNLIQLMDANKYKELPVYSGINSEFSILTTNEVVSPSDSTALIASVMSLPNAVSCIYQPRKRSLTVKYKKQENENTISVIKGKMVPFKVYIANYSEIIYKAN